MKDWWTTEVRLPRYYFWPMILLLALHSVLAVARFFAG